MMSLNIKNESVCALAKQAAELTGQTQTSAIELALLKLIAEHTSQRRDEQRAKVATTLAWLDLHVSDHDRAAMTLVMDDLYAESGLPR